MAGESLALKRISLKRVEGKLGAICANRCAVGRNISKESRRMTSVKCIGMGGGIGATRISLKRVEGQAAYFIQFRLNNLH